MSLSPISICPACGSKKFNIIDFEVTEIKSIDDLTPPEFEYIYIEQRCVDCVYSEVLTDD